MLFGVGWGGKYSIEEITCSVGPDGRNGSQKQVGDGAVQVDGKAGREAGVG